MMRGDCHCGVIHGPALERTSAPDNFAAVYDYVDEHGDTLFQCVRKHGKGFSQRRPDGAGGWVWDLQGVRRILYRLPELLSADPTARVWIVEGEKDVNTMRAAGYIATCNPMGAGKWRGVEELAREILAGRDVTIIADKDEPGWDHAAKIAASLQDVCRLVGPLECTRGKDISDHFAAGGSLGDLVAMSPQPKAIPVATKTTLKLVPSAHRAEPPVWGEDEHGPPDRPARPEIQVTTRSDEMVRQLERHMAALDPGLYQRGRELVTVLGSDSVRGVADGTPILRPLTRASILPRITEYVQFVGLKPPTKRAIDSATAINQPPPSPEPVNCLPPQLPVVGPMLERGEWPNVRLLKGVSETPFLRPDGMIVQAVGYDAVTKYLYCPSCEYPRVPTDPTQDEAKAALARLRDLFVHFPFTSEAGGYVAIAALLTALARPAIEGPVPTFIFEASVRGSGKTLQCDVVHIIATGRTAPHGEWPIDEDEQKKTMNALALSAAPIVILDNIKGLFGGQTLEGVLTSERVSFRVLGSKNTADVPWMSVILASGNNLQLTDDMCRRSLVSRLEPTESDPTTRRGLPNLPALVRENRTSLVVDALTVLRSFCSHGRPDAGSHMASYLDWSGLVANAILFAGGPDVVLARPGDEKAVSDDVGAASTIVSDLERLLGGGAMTLRSILATLYPVRARGETPEPDGFDDLREAIEMLAPLRGPKPDALLVGKRLRKFIGRWFDDLQLTVELDPKRKVGVWRVQKRAKSG